MSIHRVIERLETYVRESTWFPMGYRLVSLDRVLELIEKMRSTLPEEVGRARVIANNKERVIREAQERAQAIVSEANSAQHQLIDQHEIVRRARTTADVIMREAQDKAKKVRDGADAYAASVLADLHGRLEVALGSVQKGEEAIARTRAENHALMVKEEAAASIRQNAATHTNNSTESESASGRRKVFDAQDDSLDDRFFAKKKQRVPSRSR
jgi:hypothetical protein